MHFIKISESWRKKFETCIIMYVGIILWIYQPRIFGVSAEARCGRPGRTASSSYTPSGDSFKENEIIHYKCEKDHVLLGASERRCQRNGTWTDEIPVCSKIAEIKRIECLYEEAHLKLIKSADRNVTTCTEESQYCGIKWAGYLSSSISITEVHITVLGAEDAKMDVIVQEDIHKEKECTIKHTILDINAKSTKTIAFLCPAGTVGNTVYIKCSYNVFRICEVSILLPPVPRCLTPDTPLHGMGYQRAATNGTTYEFRCNEGYKRWGSFQVFCQTGTWRPNSPICDEIYCDAPDNITNGYVEFESKTRGVPYNGTAKYSCKEGYVLDGPSTITCYRWNEWDYSPPECILKTANKSTVPVSSFDSSLDPVSSFESSLVLTTSKVSHESTTETSGTEESCRTFHIDSGKQGEWQSLEGSSSFLVLICPENFHIEGSPAVIQCLSNGSWSYSSAVCEKSFEKTWGRNWSPSLMLIVAIAAGAGTAILILCLSIVFLVIKKRLQARTNTTVFHLEDTHKNSLPENNFHRQRHSASDSYESVIERRSKSASINSRKPRSALPNLPLDTDPVYAQPFETASTTEKLSSATANRKDDLYNTHIYAEPVDSRKRPQSKIPPHVSAPRTVTDSRESVVKNNFGKEPPLSVSTDVQNCTKKCAIYDSSDNSRFSNSERTNDVYQSSNESTELSTLPKNIEYLELL